MGLFKKKIPIIEMPRHTAAIEAMKNAVARHPQENAEVYAENVGGHNFSIPRSRVEKCVGLSEKELVRMVASWSNF